MTQKELAGDMISRNMLSLIENGAASPSISTLTYLASRLGVPAGYFIPRDCAEEEQLLRLTFIGEIRSAFAKKDWMKCIELCRPLSLRDDEILYVLASAHLSLAWSAADALDIRSAAAEIDLAEKYAGDSVYCGKIFAAAAAFYRRLLENLSTDDIPAELCDTSGCGEHLSYDIIAYFLSLKALRSGEENRVMYPRGAYHEAHLRAVEAMMDEDYSEAIQSLRKLSDDPLLPCYMRYRVLCDLERVANLCGNVRLAYNTSCRKLEIIEKCRVSK